MSSFAWGVLGIIIDQITVTISPAYFIFGKGLTGFSSLRSQVAILGFKAGSSAGAIVSSIFLFSNNKKKSPLTYFSLSKYFIWPIAMALFFSLIGMLFTEQFKIFDILYGTNHKLPEKELASFVRVWGIHLGIYFGGLFGST